MLVGYTQRGENGMLRWNIIALAAGLLFLQTWTVSCQEPEWLMRIPKYFRLKGGASDFVVDRRRNAVLFDGGAYDTYVTYDHGATWQTIFDWRMFYADLANKWHIDDLGRWYFQGRVYLKVPLGLVTEDAGQSFRYLNADSTSSFSPRYFFTDFRMVRPSTVYYNLLRYNASDSNRGVYRGLYSSCDAGMTWNMANPIGNFEGSNSLHPIEPGKILLSTYDFSLELNTCSLAFDTVKVDVGNLAYRLPNSTIIQPLANGAQRGINIFRSDTDTLPQRIEYYTIPGTNIEEQLRMSHSGRVNDTLVICTARNGVIGLYGMQSGFRFLDIPPYYHKEQQVVDVGLLGDLLLCRTYIPTGTSIGGDRWQVYNVRTGAHKIYDRPGSNTAMSLMRQQIDMFDCQRVVPFTDSVWMVTHGQGELMRTSDAGRTWSMVDNIVREERWGHAWVPIKRLYSRGNGNMSLLTDRNRLLVNSSDSETWNIAHPGPFNHVLRYVGYGDSNRVAYGEDHSGRLRHRYGPSTVYFHDKDTMWLTGDVVQRFATTGEFIDTVLPRRSRFLKRISPLVIASAMDSLYFTFNEGKEWIYVGYTLPKSVSGKDTLLSAVGDIVVADDGGIIVGLRGIRTVDTLLQVVDSIPGGLVRSIDNGVSWVRINSDIPHGLYVTALQKLPSGTLLCFAAEVSVDPTAPGGRYNAKDIFGRHFKLRDADIYRSTDHGQSWNKVFQFPDSVHLPATDMRFMMFPDGRLMALHPSAGVAISANDGRTWSIGDPLNIGDPIVNDVVFTDDGYAHLATDEGYAKILIDNIVGVHQPTSVSGALQTYVSRDGQLRISSELMPTSLTIYALDGRSVLQHQDIAGFSTVNVSAISSGIYIVVAGFGSSVQTALVNF